MIVAGLTIGYRLQCSALLGLAASAVAMPQQALAQTTAPSVQPPTREELRPLPSPQLQRESRLVVDGDIERSPCPLADPRNAAVKVTLSDVQFNNLRGVSAEELRPLYARYLGSEQSVAVLCEIRDAAATYLRDKGYLAAVQVPTQRIENGVVQFETLFARVTAIRVRGDAKGAEKRLEGYLSKLTEDEIFDRTRAERYLLLARDLPGYDVRLTLKPAGTGVGDLVGEVTVQRQPVFVDATIQNLAAPDTGRWGGQIRAQINGLTGLGDATSLSYYSTADFSEQHIVQGTHEMRIGNEGFVLSGQATYAWTKPDLNAGANAPDLTARTFFASLEGSYPLIRSQGQNLRVAGGLDFVDQRVRLIAPLSRDKLRTAYLRLDADAIDLSQPITPGWRLAGSVELRRGLDIFKASPNCLQGGCGAGIIGPSRFDGDPEGMLLRGSAEGEARLVGNLSAMLRVTGQHGFDPLPSFEEFSAGNYTVGRGYSPATIIGDSGVGVQFELRGPRFDLGKNASNKIQPYGFFDAAWVWNKFVTGADEPQRLSSVGGGLRVEIDRRARLDLFVAKPLERAGVQTERGNARVFLSFTTRIFPWGN